MMRDGLLYISGGVGGFVSDIGDDANEDDEEYGEFGAA